MSPLDYPELEQAALRLLAGREHSRLELRGKLRSRGGDPEEVERLLCQLEEQGYLNDERFLEQYVEVRTRKGFGPLRIRAELQERGLDDALISEQLQENDPDWLELMRQAARRKFGDISFGDRRQQTKVARFLEYRGFPPSLIRSLLWDGAD